MGVGEGDLGHIACSNGDLTQSSIVSPVGIFVRLIYLLNPIRAGLEADLDGAVVGRGKGRAFDKGGASLIGVDIELPAAEILTGAGLFHDLGIAIVNVIEGNGAGLACSDSQLPGGGIKVPIRTLTGFLYLFDIVGTRQESGSDQALGVGGKGRVSNLSGAGFVCVDFELPTVQGATGVGLLNDLTVAVMNVGEGHRTSLASLDHHLTGGGIVIPQRIACRLIHLFDVVGAGGDLCSDHAAGISCKRRTINQLGAVHIRIDVELPAT